jgi:hypothetical protein
MRHAIPHARSTDSEGHPYPWRCLWRGLSQRIRTTPRRRTTLHFAQIGFTDDFTFMRTQCSLLLETIRDPAPGQIIRRHFHRHLITRKNANEMHPHLARYMGQDDMSIFELHPKHRIRQSFCHGTLYFDNIFFGHVFLRSFLRLKFRLRLDGSRFEPGHLVVWQSYVRSEQTSCHQP